MANPLTSVRPFYRLVANGVEGRNLKATLIITPEPVMTGEQGIALENWPQQMARILRPGETNAKLRPHVELQIFAGADQQTFPIQAKDITIVGHGVPPQSGWDSVTTLWQKAIVDAAEGKLKNPWHALRADIELSLTGKKHEASLVEKYPKNLDTLPTQESFNQNGAIIARRPNPSDKISVSGVVANKQSDLAIDEERVRAQRVLRKMIAGPGLPGDDDDDLPAGNTMEQPVNPADYADKTDDERKEQFKIAVRQRIFDDLKRNIQDTDENRASSHERFNQIKDILDNKPAKAVKTHTSSVDSPVASPDRVTSGDGGRKLRAGHAYGGWLQNVKQGKEVSDNQEYEAHQGDSLTVVEATALERVRSIYYSLQGDFFLSRLFCLAADVTFPIPDAMIEAASKGRVYVTLAAEGCEEKRITTQTLTAAAFDLKQFWPVSRFDIPGSQAPQLVEQRSGVWMLGGGYGTKAAHDPRYQLAALDFRRSVDATEDAVDRGQRHITAGITVLDRGRGEQIARDLAISTKQSEKVCDQAQKQCHVANRHCVVLWAEELTIGRRLDVAVVKKDSQVATLKWRGLMHRQVTFDVAADVEKILRLVVGDKSGHKQFDDEASFQVVTRTMPLLGDQANEDRTRQAEAIADEALVMWDGTPLAALVQHDTDQEIKRGGPRLPITRKHGLATAGHHRPPPLRYGAGYAFSMRSVFVGGGSPSVDNASAFHVATEGAMVLPPAVKGKQSIPSKKRFLRHEGIDAPPVLLPQHLAELKHGVMGYEISDRVILRSATQSDLLTDPPDRYIDIKDRLTPDKSMRVFVAPIAALDTAIRHRKLDCDDGVEVMRGGLRNALFDPEKDGFPIVVTDKAPEFNGELASVKRHIAQNSTNAPANQKKSGAAVFTPGGVNPTPSGKTGYLPDPAAETMVVRLRIRGSGRYLSGAWVTDLYDKSVEYPHALPLVVSVEKLARARSAPVRACSEVLLGDPGAIRRIAHNGTVNADASGAGVRIRHLTVRLAQGEDFDLEVVCLPKRATLAGDFSLPETIALQIDHAASDVCAKDDLTCLCGPAAEKGLGSLQALAAKYRSAKTGTDVGLGGWAAPAFPLVEAIAQKLIDTIQSNWQIEELAAVQRVRVSHAINAPTTAPNFKSIPEVTRPLVAKSDSPDAILNAKNSQGAVISLLRGRICLDLEQSDAFELLVTTAATGGKLLDDKARSRSLLARRSGRWPEVLMKGGESHFVSTRDVLGFEVATDGRVTFPQETVTILRVDNLPDPRAAPSGDDSIFHVMENSRLTEIDLAPLHAAAIAKKTMQIPVATDAPCPSAPPRKIIPGIPFALEDVRARKIRIQVAAISRFSPLFETASFYADPANLLKRRQALASAHQTRSGEVTEFWIPSTTRPARCDARPPAPTFVFERTATKSAKSFCQTVTRAARTRLHFGRGMFSSGEGERIGIVLWPPNYTKQNADEMKKDKIEFGGRKMKLADFDDADLGPGGRFVTRWGGDPIRKDASPQQSNFIPCSAFEDLGRLGKGPHRPNYVARARMPVHIDEQVKPETGEVIVNEKEPPEFLDVSLLTYEPCFDLDREEWYVDVDLLPAFATDPFVRFGLVRYQEHSIRPELMVSEPVSVWAQVLPKRTVELTHSHEKGGISLTAVVCGQASIGIKPVPVADLGRPLTPDETRTLSLIEQPLVQMTIVHEGLTDDKVLTRTPIRFDTPIEAYPNPVNGLMEWKLKLPKIIDAARIAELGKGALVAYIEEIERRMPATYPGEPISPDVMLVEKTIVASGPRFNARIVFHVI